MRTWHVSPRVALSALVLSFSVLASSCRPSAKRAVTIGAILSLSGQRSAYGAAAKNGMDLAVDQVNRSGGVGGRPLSVVYEDGQGVARVALSAFEKLVAYDQVRLVLGPLTSSEVLSVAPEAERRRVVILSPGASSPAISAAGDFIFRNVPSDVYEGRMMGEIAARRLGLNRVAVLFVNNEYGEGVRSVFTSAFAGLGGTVVAALAFPDGGTDFRTQVLRVRAQHPQAIYLVGYKELGLLVKQCRQLGLDSLTFLSTALFEDPDVLQTAGRYAEGVVFTSITFDPHSSSSRARAFAVSYERRYGREPDGFSAVAFDAVFMAVRAIEQGGDSARGIRDALYSTRDFPGLLGQTSFDSNGDVELPVTVKVVRNGRFVRLD